MTTRPICDSCWCRLEPNRTPTRATLRTTERCTDCGGLTTSGIYYGDITQAEAMEAITWLVTEALGVFVRYGRTNLAPEYVNLAADLAQRFITGRLKIVEG